jgi:hypothetical protein
MTITILDENGNNSSSAKMRRKNKERMARENNPIELK